MEPVDLSIKRPKQIDNDLSSVNSSKNQFNMDQLNSSQLNAALGNLLNDLNNQLNRKNKKINSRPHSNSKQTNQLSINDHQSEDTQQNDHQNINQNINQNIHQNIHQNMHPNKPNNQASSDLSNELNDGNLVKKSETMSNSTKSNTSSQKMSTSIMNLKQTNQFNKQNQIKQDSAISKFIQHQQEKIRFNNRNLMNCGSKNAKLTSSSSLSSSSINKSPVNNPQSIADNLSQFKLDFNQLAWLSNLLMSNGDEHCKESNNNSLNVKDRNKIDLRQHQQIMKNESNDSDNLEIERIKQESE